MMLKYSKTLRRKIRQGEPKELAISNWDLLREAIQSGKTDDALEMVDYLGLLDKEPGLHDFCSKLLTHIADLTGEEEVMKIWYERSLPIMQAWLAATPGVAESLYRCIELQRSHQVGTFTVTEEIDRYVVSYGFCHSGGTVRRGSNVGKTKKAYPWSWSKTGVPYYCIHCCLRWEIIPIELRGYPVRITLFNENPEGPCVHLFYKKPELIPEEYFAKVGKTKTIK